MMGHQPQHHEEQQDPDRFTIADYYDREPEPYMTGGIPQHGESSSANATRQTGYPAGILVPAPAIVKPRKQVSTSSTTSPTATSSGTGSALMSAPGSRLRLHQPDERPLFLPSTLTTSPTHPLSPDDNERQDPLSAVSTTFGRMPSRSSDIRPLPSIPRSFSSSRDGLSSRDGHSDNGQALSPLMPTADSGLPLSPITSSQTLSPSLQPPPSPGGSSPALSPPILEHRNSAISGHSGVSNAWTHQDDTKEKDIEFPLAPALNRGQSSNTQKAQNWYRRWLPSSTACKLLLLTVVLESIVNLTIEGNILWRFTEEINEDDSSQMNFERKRRLPIYLIIYGLAHLWQLILVIIAIRTRNTVQVAAVTAFNFAFLGYAVIQIYELRQILDGNLEDGLTGAEQGKSLLTLPLNILTGIVIGMVSISCLALSVLTFVLRREFGWERYRFLGADLRIRKYYTRFQVYECICFFSAFFCAGFGIQFIWLVLQKTDVEYIITWIAFPLLILLLVLGRWAAKYENVYAMSVFMVGLVAGCAYFIFKLVRIWQQETTTYYRLTKSLTVFDALSLLSLGACFVYGIVVWRNFGKGLKDAGMSFAEASEAFVVLMIVVNQSSRGGSISSAIGLIGTQLKTDDNAREEGDLQQRRISID